MNERMRELPGQYKNSECCEADLKDLAYDINVVLKDKIYFPDVLCAKKNSSLESTDSSLVDYKNNSKIDEGATPAIATRPIARVAPFFNSTNGTQNSNYGDHSNAVDHSNVFLPLSRTNLHTLNSDESEATFASRELRFPRVSSSNCANDGSLSPLPRSIALQIERLQQLEQESEAVPNTYDYDEDDYGINVEPQELHQTERKELADD
ncbi:uncharacterized protein LOC127830980 [Dreissena polymorpha]|nr:uncharacterized protein LOC127830980 [Dreissena polymorpha]